MEIFILCSVKRREVSTNMKTQLPVFWVMTWNASLSYVLNEDCDFNYGGFPSNKTTNTKKI